MTTERITGEGHTPGAGRARRMRRALGIAVAFCAVLAALVAQPAAASATGIGGVSMASACQSQYPNQGRQAVVRDYHSAYSWACYSITYGFGGIDVTQECRAEQGYGAAAFVSDVTSPWSWYCDWGITSQMRNAVRWATAEKNSPDPTWSDHFQHAWSGLCEGFAEQAEAFAFRFPSAITDYAWQRDHGRLHTQGTPPPGALVFYSGNTYGHVAISIGAGQVIGTLGFYGERRPVQQYAVGYVANYLGWSFPIGS